MICVAIVIAIDEVRLDFSEVAWSDRLIAHHTKGLRAGGLRAGRPAMHKDESHVAPPNAKQSAVSDGFSVLPRTSFAEETEA